MGNLQFSIDYILRWGIFASALFLSIVTSRNENAFHVTGPLLEESAGHQWIPQTKGR